MEDQKLTNLEALIRFFQENTSIKVEKAEETLLLDYAASRTLPTDYNGRNIFAQIFLYLTGIHDFYARKNRMVGWPEELYIGDKEIIYRHLWDALLAEAQGKFGVWKYQSQDYKATLDAILEIEIARLPRKERKEARTKLKTVRDHSRFGMHRETWCESLYHTEGLTGIKNRMEEIKRWGESLQYTNEAGVKSETMDDFFLLFNLGNSRYYPSCLHCIPECGVPGKPALQRGLIGVLSSGTNRMVGIQDQNGQIVARFLIRLRIVADKTEKIYQPAIIVEPAYGETGLAELSTLIDIVSANTKLPILSYIPEMEVFSEKEKKCKIVQLENHKHVRTGNDQHGNPIPPSEKVERYIMLFGPEFDYSDCYGIAFPPASYSLIILDYSQFREKIGEIACVKSRERVTLVEELPTRTPGGSCRSQSQQA